MLILVVAQQRKMEAVVGAIATGGGARELCRYLGGTAIAVVEAGVLPYPAEEQGFLFCGQLERLGGRRLVAGKAHRIALHARPSPDRLLVGH